jgi:uncharacterized protein YjbJ (UPF0337 family)
MNEDILSGNWKQMRGKLRTWWGKLSDDDFEWISGQKDRLIGLIQEKYGCTRDQAEEDVDRRFGDYGGESAFEDMKSKAYAFGETAADRARSTFSSVADTVESASAYLRENKWETMAADLRDILRKYPFQSILLGAGLLYWISRQRR